MTSPPKQEFNYCRIIPVMIFLLVLKSASFAQMVSPSVVNTNGFAKKMENVFVSASVGESAIRTLKGTTGIITQGFLQPELKPPCSDFELDYFPNPVIDYLTVRDTACGKLIHEIEIYDLLGHRVHRARLVNREADIRVLGMGIFIVRGFSKSGDLLGSFKIVKTTD